MIWPVAWSSERGVMPGAGNVEIGGRGHEMDFSVH